MPLRTTANFMASDGRQVIISAVDGEWVSLNIRGSGGKKSNVDLGYETFYSLMDWVIQNYPSVHEVKQC